MDTYANLGGNSGVLRYEIGNDNIVVEFNAGAERFYKYTYVTPGAHHVEEMKRLARQGSGLNSYISSVVKSRYESKW